MTARERARNLYERINLTWLSLGALAAAAAFGATTKAKADMVASAVPRPEFFDTVKVIRTDIASVARQARDAADEARAAAEASRAVSCYMAKYPAGLCDNVTRQPEAQQAGSPSR